MEPIQQTEKENLFSYLDQILTSESVKIVGKLLKRIELLLPEDDFNPTDKKSIQILKKEQKELVYECFREIRDIFTAYSHGLEVSRFNFIKPSKEK